MEECLRGVNKVPLSYLIRVNPEVPDLSLNPMQVEKPIELASSEPSYPTDDKIASVMKKSSEILVEPFVKRKRRYPNVIHRQTEYCDSLNAAEKIAEEVIDHKTEASGGSAGRAFETAIIDSIDASDAVAEAVTNGAKAEALAVRDLKAVS